MERRTTSGCTFTAKAHELITRRAIDQALLIDPMRAAADEPETIRLPVDDPYVDAKAYLLHVIASHARCRAVIHGDYALCSVIGFAGDLRAVEMMFTSLLVQGQTALTQAARSAPSEPARAANRSGRRSGSGSPAVSVAALPR